MLFLLGEEVRIPIDTFSDPAMADPGDPDALDVVVTRPNKTTATEHWPPAGTIVRDALGQFHLLVVPDSGGFWSAHADATGAITTAEAYSWYVATEPPYLLPADVRNVLAGTAALTGSAATLSDDDLFEAIFEAQSEVNARLAARYTVPFADDVPPLVISITRDIAGYLATLTYRRGEPVQTGDPVLLRYTRAQALLTQAANGNLVLPIADGIATGNEAATANAVVANPVDGDLWTVNDFDLRTRVTVPGWPW